MTFVPTPFATPIVLPSAAAGDAFRRIGYISVSEYRFAPTAVPTNSLVPTAPNDAAASTSALAQVIMRASAWVDEHCFHRADGTLAASVSTEARWVKVKPDGSIAFICNFRPVIEVVGMGMGPGPAQVQNISQTTANSIAIRGKVLQLPAVSSHGPRPFFGSWPSVTGEVYVVTQYVSGFPHMALGANALAGATSITVIPAVTAPFPSGVYAGTRLTIRDGTRTETIQVAVTPTGNVLTLAHPLRYAHTLPAPPDSIMVSAVPWQIEQATISLTSVLIKAQGDRSMTLNSVGRPPTRVAAFRAGAAEDFDNAMRLLKSFVVAFLN
jgi:hypothetical protein